MLHNYKPEEKIFCYKFIRVIINIFSICFLITPESVSGILMSVIIGIGLSILVFYFYDKIQWEKYIHMEMILIDLIIIIVIGNEFYIRWLPSSKVTLIANICHLSASRFLIFMSLILGCMAIGTVDGILWMLKLQFDKIVDKLNKEKVYNYLFIFFIIMLEYIAIEYSSVSSLQEISKQGMPMLLLNLLLVLVINIVVLLIFQKWKITLVLTSVIFCIWSIANYYVIMFHGSPLYLSELNNMKTAFAVASSYSYNISVPVILSVIILLSQINYIYKYILTDNTLPIIKRFLVRCSIVGASCIVIYAFMDNFLKDEGWLSWKESIKKYGFMICVAKDVNSSSNPIIEPDGYEVAKISSLPVQENIDNNEYPDIIMILNESFYDLGYYCNIETDAGYLDEFYSIPNAVYGHAIIPNIGGGTNNSEFELLYSKSMYLLAGPAPFTYLNHNLEERSVVSYLNELGYTTVGMHCGGEQNYSRHIAYPAMKFDNIFLGPDAFSYISSNGNRSWLDKV